MIFHHFQLANSVMLEGLQFLQNYIHFELHSNAAYLDNLLCRLGMGFELRF